MAEREQILACLRRRERCFWLIIGVKLIAGMLISMLGPLLIATWLTIGRYTSRNPMPWSFWQLFWGSAAIVVPILHYIEWITQGRFFEQQAPHIRRDTDMPEMYIEWHWRTRRAGGVAALEILLSGPRLVHGAIEQWREAHVCRGAIRERAAMILELLEGVDGGIALEHLLMPHETIHQIEPTFRYLMLHEWIDASRDGARVWLLGDARDELKSI